MANAPRLKRIRLLAAKIETTPGDIETLAAEDAVFRVFNLLLNPDTEMEERPAQAGFGYDPAVPGARKGRCRFSSYLYGATATPAWAATFLPSIGMGSTGTAYKLDPRVPEISGSPLHTLTLAGYQNGTKKAVFGAMGNGKFTFPAGKCAFGEFDYPGKWARKADIAILVPTYDALPPLRVVSSELAIGAKTPKVAQVTIDLGNVVHLREDTRDALGIHSAVIANRKTILTLDPESRLVAEEDWYGDWLAGAEANLTLKCVAGDDLLTVTATKLQIQRIEEADREGVETESLQCSLNADDLTFTFE